MLAACCTALTTANKAPYRFGYSVSDPLTGDMKEQEELKDCDQVAGYYKTLDADGLMRTVVYNSHPLTGFQAQVSREPIGRPVAVAAAAAPAVIPVTAAPILRTAGIAESAGIITATAATPLMGPRIAGALAAPAVSSQMMHKVDVGPSWQDGSILRTAAEFVAPAPILRTAEIAAPAPILAATAAPLMETRIAAAPPAWSSQMMHKVDATPILRPAIAETEFVAVTQAPAILRSGIATEHLEPARILTGGASYGETKLASSVIHQAPISFAGAPARILSPAMPYGLPASSASFQSYAGHWQNNAGRFLGAAAAPQYYSAGPIATAAAPIPYAGRFLGAAPIAATAATVLEPCK